jgi:putative heme degradation protein
MMTEQATRRILREPADHVLGKLPLVGKLMIIGKRNGVTHERIGPVATVTAEGEWIFCRGDHHDSRIDPGLVASIVADTSSVMQGQVYPRLDFNDARGEPVFSVVGFDGLEPFEQALAGLRLETEEIDGARPERPERPNVADDDPGLKPFNLAIETARPVVIAFSGPGFDQSWSGIVEKVKPAMGFINVMTSDFHLHLLGGAVASWVEREEIGATTFCALDAGQKEIGLNVRLVAAASN